MEPTIYHSMTDELTKIAASRGRMTVPQSRSGRRPMRVDTLLRKEKDGSLYKAADLAQDMAQKLLQAKQKASKPGQYPTSDDIGRPGVEDRQTVSGTTAIAQRIGDY